MEARNLCIKTDSYKASHFRQFPAGTDKAFYYVESRDPNANITVFGLQYILQKHLAKVPTFGAISDAAKFWAAHGEPFNREGWYDIAKLGYYPLKIKAVPEGLEIPGRKIMISVENTLPGYHWLCGWIETLLMQVWYPTTVATRSKRFKKIISKYLEKTGDPAGLMFKLHDFGYRGVTCQEQAEIGAMAHLVNFMGTDTVAGIFAAQDYYGPEDEMFAFSIPAAEHSTIGAWGKDGEVDAFKNMLDQFGAGPLVAVVSDTYDLENAVKNYWGKQLKYNVEQMNATLVIRPDSGDPVEEVLNVARWVDEAFGSTINEKGYKVLNNVAIIHGDGIDDEYTFEGVLSVLTDAGYSADNIAFGMGAGLLQKVNRDTFKFAMKCSAIRVDGKWRDVFKDPVGAPWKRSKKGRFTLTKDFKEREINDSFTLGDDLMKVVYEDGELKNKLTFNEVRENAAL